MATSAHRVPRSVIATWDWATRGAKSHPGLGLAAMRADDRRDPGAWVRGAKRIGRAARPVGRCTTYDAARTGVQSGRHAARSGGRVALVVSMVAAAVMVLLLEIASNCCSIERAFDLYRISTGLPSTFARLFDVMSMSLSPSPALTLFPHAYRRSPIDLVDPAGHRGRSSPSPSSSRSADSNDTRHTSNRCLNVSVTFSRVTSWQTRTPLPLPDPPPIRQPPRRRGRPRASDVAAQLAGTGSVSSLPDGPADAHGLTLRQRRILEMINDTVETRGYPPSIREMGDAVGLASLLQRRPPAQGAREQGLPAPRPQPSARPRGAAARRGRSDRAPEPARRHADGRRSTRPAWATPTRRRCTSRCWAGSPPVGRSWPRSGSRTSSPCPASWSARAPCSCSRSGATR